MRKYERDHEAHRKTRRHAVRPRQPRPRRRRRIRRARRAAPRQLPCDAVEYGYLEFARPIIRDGLDRLRAQGRHHVLAVPGMLFAAGHAKNDIPSVLNTYAGASTRA